MCLNQVSDRWGPAFAGKPAIGRSTYDGRPRPRPRPRPSPESAWQSNKPTKSAERAHRTTQWAHLDTENQQTPRSRSIGIAALLALIVCWAFVPVLLRDLADSLDAWTANGIRYPLSAILYWPVLWRASRRTDSTDQPVLNFSLLRACMIPALCSTFGQFVWALAHYYLQASQIGFLIRATTIVAITGAMILFPDERRLLREPRFYVGAWLAIGGFIALSLFGGTAVGSANTTGLGIMFLCSLFFGLYIVSVRKCIPDVNPILAFAIVAQICSVVLVIAMLVKGDYSVIMLLSPRDWTLLVASSLLGIGFGHVLLYIAVVRLGASVTTTCQSVMPFLTAAIASVMLGEQLTPAQWLSGCVIVVGAIILLSVKQSLSRPLA